MRKLEDALKSEIEKLFKSRTFEAIEQLLLSFSKHSKRHPQSELIFGLRVSESHGKSKGNVILSTPLARIVTAIMLSKSIDPMIEAISHKLFAKKPKKEKDRFISRLKRAANQRPDPRSIAIGFSIDRDYHKQGITVCGRCKGTGIHLRQKRQKCQT